MILTLRSIGPGDEDKDDLSSNVNGWCVSLPGDVEARRESSTLSSPQEAVGESAVEAN